MRAGSCSGPESKEWETWSDECGARLRLRLKCVKDGERKREKSGEKTQECDVHTDERREEGRYSQFPFSEYKIIWSITHPQTLLRTIHRAPSSPKAFLSGRITSELHCLFCPRVRICHMSKAAPLAEYFTRLSVRGWDCVRRKGRFCLNKLRYIERASLWFVINVYLVFKSQLGLCCIS